jgi:hypothetical protein
MYGLAKVATGVPGAGSYQPMNDISDSGKYVLSTNKGAGRRRFDKEFRESFVHIPAKITKSMYASKKRPAQAHIVSRRNSVSTTKQTLPRATSNDPNDCLCFIRANHLPILQSFFI